MNKKLAKLLEDRKKAVADARAMLDNAEGDFSEADQAKYDAMIAGVQSLTAQIDREKELVAFEADTSVALEVADDAIITGGEDRRAYDDRRGFDSYGDFAMAVIGAGVGNGVDQRLLIGAAAPTTYGNESVGADGGFLVPPEYSREIWGLSLEENAFLPLTDNMNVGGNSMTFPSDETTPWGTDGIRAYWESEASQANQTKPKIKPNTMRLKKLFALVPVTEELMADTTGLSSYLAKKTAESIRYKTNDAIMNGDGAGKPLGLVGHNSEVSVAKETSQTADTVNANNVVKMFARALNPGRSVWVINPDVFPQLPLMSIGNQPIWIDNGSFKGTPGGSLLGRPIIMSDTCQTVGNANDINFVDFSKYRTLTKAGGIETATSMHLYFDSDAMAFRAIFRVDGQPVLSAAITPPNSTATRSGMVSLAERA